MPKIRMNTGAYGEIDFSSVWSWTVPLWGLFVIVLFLGGILTQETTILALPGVSIPSAPMVGAGMRAKKRMPQ